MFANSNLLNAELTKSAFASCSVGIGCEGGEADGVALQPTGANSPVKITEEINYLFLSVTS